MEKLGVTDNINFLPSATKHFVKQWRKW